LRILLPIWIILLVPWIPFAAFSGMAFDGGYTWRAYVFFWSVLTYPIMLGAAVVSLYRGKSPFVVDAPST